MEGMCYFISKDSKSIMDKQSDPMIPLKKIWSIVGEHNVWANIQETGATPALIDFDLDNPTKWKPFLPKDGND